MQEDTKPENDDIQDEERKTPFSRSEYHGVITSYAGLALSLIAIILSVITMYQSHMMETREIVQILRAEDDGYYHFDGEKLFKNFQVTVANNSAIPVSVVEITIERDGEARTFEISDLPDILPLNMEANHTEMITIPWNIDTSTEDAQRIQKFSQETLKGSDIVLPSEILNLDNGLTTIDTSDFKGSFKGVSIGDKSVVIILDGSVNPVLSQSMFTLTVTLSTAKNNQYTLFSSDTGSPKGISESTWVGSRITLGNRTANTEAIESALRDFIEALQKSQNSE